MARLNIDIDNIPLSFGKHKGKTPAELAGSHAGYVVWLFENVTPCPVSKDLYDACYQDMQDDNHEEYRWSIY